MAVGCGATCSKVILITFNFLFWLSGVALLVLGIWIVADPSVENNLRMVEDPDASLIMTKYLAFALIAIGGLVFVIGFLGCCGALKENKCLLGLYLFFLIIIAGAEIAAGVLGFIQKDKIEKKISATLNTKWGKHDNGTANTATEDAIKYVQEQLKCCRPDPIPEDKAAPEECNGHKAGCIEKLRDWVKGNAPILIGVACGFGGLEIFGIICAICLCRAVGEKDD
jgi:hypothetical protein